MISSDFTRPLLVPESHGKIVLLVIDGLGGLPDPATGRSELDSATLPNLDRIARSGSCGSLTPLGPGFTPGSGPAHLALFGYDPWRWQVGGGAVGVGNRDGLPPWETWQRGSISAASTTTAG